jgi:hypothetical protein
MEMKTVFDSCLTIVFVNKNHSPESPTVWVCRNQESYEKSLKKLNNIKHVEIIQSGFSHIAVD